MSGIQMPISSREKNEDGPLADSTRFDGKKLEHFQAKLGQVTGGSSSDYVLIPWVEPQKAARAAMYSAAAQDLEGNPESEQRYRCLVFLDAQTLIDDSMLLSQFVTLAVEGFWEDDYRSEALI